MTAFFHRAGFLVAATVVPPPVSNFSLAQRWVGPYGAVGSASFSFVDDFFQTSTTLYGSAYITAPAVNTHPHEVLTYTNPRLKMVLGPDGLLRYAPHNAFYNTDDITGAGDFYWANNGTTKQATTEPNPLTGEIGEVARIVPGNFSPRNIRVFGQNFAPYLTEGPVTVKIYVKPEGDDFFYIRHSINGSFNEAWFNVGNGTLGTIDPGYDGARISAVPGDFGAGWYLCEVDYTITFGASNDGLHLFAPQQSENIFQPLGNPCLIWMPQWLQRPSQDGSIHNRKATSTAFSYAIPLEWDAAGQPLGALIEEQRTNNAIASSDFLDAAWSPTSMTVAQTATGPDGVANSAGLLTATAGNATLLQTVTLTDTAVASFYLRRSVGTGTIEITQDSGVTWTAAAIDGNWQRFTTPSQSVANDSIGVRIVTSGDAVEIYGAQSEVGAFLTSHIPTAGATVTRNADDITLLPADFPHADAVQSFFVDWDTDDIDANTSTGRIRANTVTQSYDILNLSQVTQDYVARIPSLDTVISLESPATAGPKRGAAAVVAGDKAAAFLGALSGTDTTATVTNGLVRVDLGSNNQGMHLNGHMKTWFWANTRIPNTDGSSGLQEITALNYIPPDPGDTFTPADESLGLARVQEPVVPVIPIIRLGGWAPTEAEFWEAWEQMGVGQFVEDPDTGQQVWQYTGIYGPDSRGVAQMDTSYSWGGTVLAGNKHPDGPSNDPENPNYVDGWHTNIIIFGQELLTELAAGFAQTEVIGTDPETGEDIIRVKEVWERTLLDTRDYWGLNSFPQGIPGLGFPPGYGKPPGLEGVMFSDRGFGRFTSPSNIF